MHIIFPSYYRLINADFAKGAFFLTANIKKTGAVMGYIYAMQNVENLFMHCWSLSVEMQWYLLAPLLIVLQKALTKYNRLFFIAVAAISFYNFAVTDSDEAFFSVWCRLWQFACGIIAFLFTHKEQHGDEEEREGIIMLEAAEHSDKSYHQNLSVMLFLVLANPMVIPYAYDHLLRVHATAFTMLLLVIGHREKIAQISIPCHPRLVYVGDISYALYLVHWPICKFTKYLWPGALWVCEVLSITDDLLCKTRVNYIEIIEELKPNLVFILDRKVVAKKLNVTNALDNDYVFMQHLYNLVSIEQIADKVFILDALPSCQLSCSTMALDFMMKGNRPLRDIGSWLILDDDKPARIRHKELRKRCKKCELIDYLPVLADDDGVYRGYDRKTNLIYIDELNHLNTFGIQRVKPLFDRLAEHVEKDLIGMEEV
ncbi:hypothetical protein Q1695_007282 [Nippostrongylus brasiliensis]|nr:hypothetical protein Q1695_007282 [Nippostrongylus brasiliensis]